jgi:polygalacturonase
MKKAAFVTTFVALAACAVAHPVFNVRDYGATGRKQDNARPALQQAIDACSKAGGRKIEKFWVCAIQSL